MGCSSMVSVRLGVSNKYPDAEEGAFGFGGGVDDDTLSSRPSKSPALSRPVACAWNLAAGRSLEVAD